MNVEDYNVKRLSNVDFSFISKGKNGEFNMRINFFLFQKSYLNKLFKVSFISFSQIKLPPIILAQNN